MELERRLSWGLMATDFQERINMDRMRQERLARTRAKLNEKGIAAALLMGDNARYATGIRSTVVALVFADGQDTVIFAWPERGGQIMAHCPWIKPENVRSFPILEHHGGIPALESMVAIAVKQIVQALRNAKVDKEKIGAEVMPELRMGLEKAGINVVPVGTALLEAREIKTEDEVNCMRMVGALADTAWSKMIESVKPGITDAEVASVGAAWLISKGAENFTINLRSGPIGAPNWGLQTDRMMQPGDLGFGYIMGNLYMGYHACYHRTWVVGIEPTQKQKDWYKKCYDWIVAVQDAIKPGATTADVARKFPTCDVYGLAHEYEVASNAIGHGVGIGDHDIPTISRAWSIDNPQPIIKGQCIALHIWYGEKGVGGCRIENIGVVTDSGWENFFTMPYDGIFIPPYQLKTAK
jgi:Xaa-Pro aminopeptidase